MVLTSAYMPPVSWFQAINQTGSIYIEGFDNYTKQTVRNRCRIADSNGVQTLTVPVESSPFKIHTRDVRISAHHDWRHQHKSALETAYMNSPFFLYYKDDIFSIIDKKYTFLYDLNMDLSIRIAELMQIKTSIQPTDSYMGVKNEPEYTEKPYWQVFANKHGFTGGLSIVDLLFNTGPEFVYYL